MNVQICSACGFEQAEVVRGAYPFAECGLANVTLQGIEIVNCPACGEEEVLIPGLDGLMKTLVEAVLAQPAQLTGAEIRFLRKNLGLTGDEFASLLGTDKTTLSKWETAAQRPGDRSDRLIRAVTLMILEMPEAQRAGFISDFARPRRQTPTAISIDCSTPSPSIQYA